MSTTIDSKVVEMKFDNSKFESNVKQTMSTLDKLKASLAKISGKHATLDVDTSSTNKGILSIGNAVDSVSSKFNALEAVAFGALAKIGSQALVAGENLIKSLSVDNIAAGWSKYDEKTSSVQTLVNSTGKSVEEINKYLDQLMWYSDETSYSFTEMTSALAQMTSTGGDIDKLIPTITGIANATAYAGKTGEAFNHTIRNITQSYNAGYLQLMDWKSLNLAGTSSKQLTEQLIKAAEELGTVQKGFLTIENFAEHLKDKNITSDVMDLAFSRFSAMSQEAYKLVQSGEFDTASEAIEAIADDFDNLASRAFKSAQEAKTFTEALDATKDAVSSGWMSTFEIIFGNYEQAKVLWTDIANRMWDFFAGGAEGRNAQLTKIMGSNFDNVTSKIAECGIESEEFEKQLERVLTENNIRVDTIKDQYGSLENWLEQSDGKYNHFVKDTIASMAYSTKELSDDLKVSEKNIEDFHKVIDKISKGKIKNAATAIKELEKANIKGAEAQEMVNKFYESGGKKVLDLQVDARKLEQTMLDLNKAQVSSYGYTEEQMEALQELARESRLSNTELGQLIDTINRPAGREMLLNSLFNTLDSFEAIVAAVKDAFTEIFPPTSALTIQNIIANIEKLTSRMKDFFASEENADKLKRTFKGLFAVLDIIKIVFKDIGKILLSVIEPIFGKVNFQVLDLTASLGDNLVKIRDWIKANDKIGVITAWLSNKVEKAVTVFKSWTKEGGLLNNVFKVMSKHLVEIKDAFGKWLDGLIESEDKPKYIIDSLISAFENGIPRFIEAASKAIDELIGAIKKSTDEGKFNEAGESALQSFINGFKNEDGLIFETFKEIGQKLLDRVKSLPWEKIFAIGLAISLIRVIKNIGKTVEQIENMISPIFGFINSLKGLISSVASTFKEIGKAVGREALGDMALKFAQAIAIIIGAVVILAQVPYEKALNSAVIIGGIITVFALALTLLNTSMMFLASTNPVGYISAVLAYMGLIAALTAFIGVVSGMVVKMSKTENLQQGLKAMWDIFVALGLIIAAIALIAPKMTLAGTGLDGMTHLMLGISAFVIASGLAIKMVGSLDENAFTRGMAFFGAMWAFIASILAISAVMKEVPSAMDKFGEGMLKIAASMAVTAVAFKIIGSMSSRELIKATAFLVLIGVFIGIMMVLTKNISYRKAMVQFGKMMIELGAAMLLTAVAMKILGNLRPDEIAKGILFMGSFFVFTMLMAKVTRQGGKEIKGFSKLMMSLGTALLLMAVSVKLLGGMDSKKIAKGEAAVLGLALIMKLIISSFKGFAKEAPKIASALLATSICIGILAVVVFLLGQLSPETLKKGLAAVSVLGLIMAGLIAVTKLAKNTKGMTATLAKMMVMFVTLTTCLLILTLVSDKGLLEAAESMTMVMGALAILMVATGKVKANKSATKAFVAMGAILAEIAIVLGLLSNFGDVEALIPSAVALSIVLLAITGALAILSHVKSIKPEMVLQMALMGAIVATLGLVLGALSALGLETSISEAIALGILIDLLAVALIPLSVAGATWQAALAGVGVLEALIVATTAVVTGIGVLFEKFDSDFSSLKNGVEALTLVGEAIGGFIGGIITGFGKELLSLLPAAGKALSDFYLYAMPFIMGMATLPPGVAEGAEALASALLKITAGEALQIIVSAFTGGTALTGEVLKQSFTAIGEALMAFANSLGEFSDADAAKIETAANAAKHLSDFVNGLPTEGGWKGKILGEQDFGKFAENLKAFGPALKGFADDVDGLNTDAISNAVTAAQGLSDFANSLPSYDDESIQGWIMGKQINVQEFGQQLRSFGLSLVGFSESVSGDNAINEKAIDTAVKAAGKLSDLANELPSTGGVFGEWFGTEHIDIGTFGEQLGGLASGLSSFSTSGNGIIEESMKRAVSAVSDLVDISVKLSTGEFDIFGSDSIKKLGEDLPGLGTALVSFNTSIGSLSAASNSMGYALDNLRKVVDVIVLMQGVDYEYIYSFKDALNSLAEFDMQGLVNTFTVEGIEQVGTAGRKLATSISEGLQKGDSDIKRTAGLLMTTILNEIHIQYENFRTSGYNLTEELRAGLRLGQDSVKNTARDIALAASKAINGTYSYFVNAGRHLTAGLNEGIKNGEGSVVDAAASLANNMAAAMKNNLKIESPSKVAAEIGKYFDLGLVMGMENYSDKIYNTAVELSDKTLEGVSSSIDRIYEVIDADLNPVITPMINLDYVKKGVDDINSMFNAKTLNASSELQNGAEVDSSGTNISFTQINNSPKALSRIEIYRQTRNQIAQLKGALN